MRTTYDSIHLGHEEWGSATMRSLAKEHFAENPDCAFVEVHEHAGWYLGFRRDGSTWLSANDRAVLAKPFPQPTGFSGTEIRRP